MMCSAWKLNKQGDSIEPWHIPFPIWNQSALPCPVLTVASWPTYRYLKRQVRWSGNPISWIIFHSFFVIYTVKGFGIVNKAEGVFLEVSCFSNDPTDVGNFINNKESNCQHLLDCHGEGPGDPLQCSCLQKSHERRSLGWSSWCP